MLPVTDNIGGVGPDPQPATVPNQQPIQELAQDNAETVGKNVTNDKFSEYQIGSKVSFFYDCHYSKVWRYVLADRAYHQFEHREVKAKTKGAGKKMQDAGGSATAASSDGAPAVVVVPSIGAVDQTGTVTTNGGNNVPNVQLVAAPELLLGGQQNQTSTTTNMTAKVAGVEISMSITTNNGGGGRPVVAMETTTSTAKTAGDDGAAPSAALNSNSEQLEQPELKIRRKDNQAASAEANITDTATTSVDQQETTTKHEYMLRPIWGLAHGWVEGKVVDFLYERNTEIPDSVVKGLVVVPAEKYCFVEAGSGYVDEKFQYRVYDKVNVELLQSVELTGTTEVEMVDVDHQQLLNGKAEKDGNKIRVDEKQQLAPVENKIDLSLFILRWFDYWSDKRKSEYKITQEWPVYSLIEQAGVKAAVGNRFECYELFCFDEECLTSFVQQHVLHLPEEKKKVEQLHQTSVVKMQQLAQLQEHVLDQHDPSSTTTKSCSKRRPFADLLVGKAKCGLYYLWPAEREFGPENRHPKSDAGMVKESVFFEFMRQMENTEIHTRYPAPSHLYRQLCGKQYYNAGCQNRELKTPATTRVYATSIKKDSLKAAKNAINALRMIRKNVWGNEPIVPSVPLVGEVDQAKKMSYKKGCISLVKQLEPVVTLNSDSTTSDESPASTNSGAAGDAGEQILVQQAHDSPLPPPDDEAVQGTTKEESQMMSGVVKLGFSWMGVDVKVWHGAEDLAKKLESMICCHKGQIATSVIVQELVPDRIAELRIHAFGVPKESRAVVPTDFVQRREMKRLEKPLVDVKRKLDVLEKENEKLLTRDAVAVNIGKDDVVMVPAEDDGTVMESYSTGEKKIQELRDQIRDMEHLFKLSGYDAAEISNCAEHNFYNVQKEMDLTRNGDFDMKVAYMGIESNVNNAGLDMTGHINQTPKQALEAIWGGDGILQAKMEEQAKELTRKWLTWYHSEWPELNCPSNGRFDYHVVWNKETMKEPELWVCEITECGASLCGLPIQARNTAIVNSCLSLLDADAGERMDFVAGEQAEVNSAKKTKFLAWPCGSWDLFSEEYGDGSKRIWYDWPEF
ncbi:unnamed protein product [Amoebophrya sp. A120]|nr:unnamed protein product [Amoebophrya sp. A120]|eukprot:GSA120T00023760001.1